MTHDPVSSDSATGSGSKSPVKDALLNGAVALAGLTAITYLLGQAFHKGYLDAFGLDDALFPYSVDQTISQAWSGAVAEGLPLLFKGVVLLAIGFGILFGLAFGLDRLDRARHSNPTASRIWHHIFEPDVVDQRVARKQGFADSVFRRLLASLTVVGTGLAVLTLYSVMYSAGGKAGEEAKTAFGDRTERASGALFSIRYDSAAGSLPTEIRARLIDAAGPFIAVYHDGRVMVIPHASVRSIVVGK